MKIRSTATLVLGVALIALVGVGVWQTGSQDTPASAQEVMARACTEMAKTDQFDYSAHSEGTEDGVPYSYTIEEKGSVSGKDLHVTYSANDEQINEFIRIGSDLYLRTESDSAWTVRNVDAAVSAYDHLGLGDTPICPDLTNVTRKGEEDLNGVKTTRYVSGDIDGSEKETLQADGDFRGHKYIYFHEFWIDTNGLLVQHRMHFLLLSQRDQDTGETSRNISEGSRLSRFIGIGEANTITAPVLGE